MRVASQDRQPSRAPSSPASGARPVMLVTFDVPFEPEAAEIAVDSAVESGQPLIVVNAAEVPLGPISLAMGYEYAGTDEVEEALRAPAELASVARRRGRAAAALQPASRSTRCSSSSPSARPGLLVVGPDRERLQAAHLRAS